MNNTEILGYLPQYYKDVLEFKQLSEVENQEIDQLKEYVADLFLQSYIDSATWGLDLWENLLDLNDTKTLNYEDRRSIIKGKIRGLGKIGEQLIKEVADAWTNGEVEVTFENNGITVQFTSFIGTPSNIDGVRNAIERIKPAHLNLAFSNRYFTISELQQITIEQLQGQIMNKFAPFV